MAFPFPGGGLPAGAKGPVKHHRCDERCGVESPSPVPAPPPARGPGCKSPDSVELLPRTQL